MSLLDLLPGLDRRRRRLLRRAPPGPLREFLEVPFPPRASDCRRVSFVALDLETTGLDPAADEIMSVGWVCLTGERIDLSTAGHRLVLPSRPVPEETAILHGITDDMAARGAPPRDVLAEVLSVLGGKVLVAHNASFELDFLGAACARVLGGRFLAPAVDTLTLAGRWLQRHDVAFAPGELRLDALRRRHNLPRYRAHNALSDALAAAELFLAQLAQRDRGRAVPLASVLLPG
jgi:DNA polymerase III subunit epsilon